MNLTSSPRTPRFSLIVAADEEGGIGLNGNIPWDLPEDRAYFRQVTSDTLFPTKRNCVIMGRKTYMSIPPKFRPFPNRLNVILTRTTVPDPDIPVAVLVRNSLETAIAEAYEDSSVETVFVIGGGEVYRQALAVDPSIAVCERIYYTNIKGKFGCDCKIPSLAELKVLGFTQVPTVHRAAKLGIREKGDVRFEYITLERTSK